jgi:hypothetical protein
MRSLSLVLCLLAACPIWAQAISIINPGFEANVINPGTFIVLDPTGWNRYDPSGIINQNVNAVGVIRPAGTEFFPSGAPEAVNAALVFLAGTGTAPAGLQQTLTSSLVGNTRYTLSVQIGNIASGTSLPGSSDGGGVFYNLNGFPGYRIDLLAGGVVIASDNNSLGALIPEGEWRQSTLMFDSPLGHPLIGQSLGIRLVNLHQAGTAAVPNIEVDFDDVRLTAVAIPEPATWALMLVTGIFAGPVYWWRRRVDRDPVFSTGNLCVDPS